MAEDFGGSVVWHPEVITASTAETLRTLRDGGFIGDAYLAEGTGLALRFNEGELLGRLQMAPEFSVWRNRCTRSTS